MPVAAVAIALVFSRPETTLAVTRGAARLMVDLGYAPLLEVGLPNGRRADVMALGPKGEIWIVECKSSRADFKADQKWQGYLDWCDRFFWAVGGDFPVELLPEGQGLMLADAYDAEVIRMSPETPLAPARRKVMVQKFARHAASRLQAYRDPGVAGLIL